MECHEVARSLVLDPALPTPRRPPPVDDVRPPHCPHCGALARCDGRVVLEGNGTRERPVVVARPRDGHVALLRETCWSRRFRCTASGTSTLVLPRGVVPGFLFSVPAMIWAWMLLHPLVSDLQETEEVCAPLGADRLDTPSKPRWRLPYVWSRRIARFWPRASGPAGGWLERVGHLLVDLAREAVTWDPLRLLRLAARTHVHGGRKGGGARRGFPPHHGGSSGVAGPSPALWQSPARRPSCRRLAQLPIQTARSAAGSGARPNGRRTPTANCPRAMIPTTSQTTSLPASQPATSFFLEPAETRSSFRSGL